MLQAPPLITNLFLRLHLGHYSSPVFFEKALSLMFTRKLVLILDYPGFGFYAILDLLQQPAQLDLSNLYAEKKKKRNRRVLNYSDFITHVVILKWVTSRS